MAEMALLEVVEDFIARNGYSPTVRELAERQGLSPAGVYLQLKKLREQGFLEWKEGVPRTLRVVAKPAG